MIITNKQGFSFIQQKRKNFVKDKVKDIQENFVEFSQMKTDNELYEYVSSIEKYFFDNKFHRSRVVSFFIDLDIDYAILKYFETDKILQRNVLDVNIKESERSNNLINRAVEIISKL